MTNDPLLSPLVTLSIGHTSTVGYLLRSSMAEKYLLPRFSQGVLKYFVFDV